MARIVVDCSICCKRDEFFARDLDADRPFIRAVAQEIVDCFGRPADVAIYNRELVRGHLEEIAGEVVRSSAGFGPRSWNDVVSEIQAEGLDGGDDDMLIVMPFKGEVSAERLRDFMGQIDKGRVTLSSRSVGVNRNPFWLYAIYPDFKEEKVIRDVNVSKLPRLGKAHFTEEAKQGIPFIGKLNGSHELPNVYDRKDAFAHVPASLLGTAVQVTDDQCQVVTPQPARKKPHLYYMLPIFNFHPDAEIDFPAA